MLYFDYPYAQKGILEESFDSATPSDLRVFGETARYGLEETSINVLADAMLFHLTGMVEDPMPKEEWEASPYFDPEIEWNESMTRIQAQMTKKALDRDREFHDWMRNVDMFSLPAIGGFAFSGMTDPIVLAPFTGVAGHIMKLGRYARVGGMVRPFKDIFKAGLSGGLAETTFQGIYSHKRDLFQQHYDASMLFGSIGLATGLSSSIMAVSKVGGLVAKLPVGQRLFNTAKAVSQLGEDGTVDLSRGKIKGDEYMNYPEANVYNEKNGAQKFTEPDIGGEPTGSGRRIKDPTGSIKSRPSMADEQPKNRGFMDLIDEKIKTFTALVKKQVQADETMQQAGQGVKTLYRDAYRWLENNIARGKCK